MPIYEYRCENGHVFDVMQSFSDQPIETCERCDAPVHKVLHPPAIRFKGPGFHNTDYGKRSRSSGGEKHRKPAAVSA